jgi:hypothetical protein
VVESDKWIIGRGKVIDVDVNRYLAAIRGIFPAYVDMAFKVE